jgi:hypothetical protein
MEITGDDKRIRALFSEARFVDERGAPSFASTWHRAGSRARKPRRAFKLSFVTAAALLIMTLGYLAVWSKLSQPNRQVNNPVAATSARSLSNQPQTDGKSDIATAALKKPLVRPAQVRSVAEKHAAMLARNRKAAEEAKQIASWTSPTASLLSSSSDDLFKSLPQLNENATDLKSFLPNRSSNKEN